MRAARRSWDWLEVEFFLTFHVKGILERMEGRLVLLEDFYCEITFFVGNSHRTSLSLGA
jgi:hypothetical protein